LGGKWEKWAKEKPQTQAGDFEQEITETTEGNRRRTKLELALLVFEQVENIGAYLRWIGVPTVIPVRINLPTNTGKAMSVLGTPLANLGMGVARTRIRAEVGGSHHGTGGQLRAMNAVIAGKSLRCLRSYLN